MSRLPDLDRSLSLLASRRLAESAAHVSLAALWLLSPAPTRGIPAPGEPDRSSRVTVGDRVAAGTASLDDRETDDRELCTRLEPAESPEDSVTVERSSDMLVVKIILAILLPPVAAALQVGISTHFWINLILTLLGGIPGMIHALWLVLTNKSA